MIFFYILFFEDDRNIRHTEVISPPTPTHTQYLSLFFYTPPTILIKRTLAGSCYIEAVIKVIFTFTENLYHNDRQQFITFALRSSKMEGNRETIKFPVGMSPLHNSQN